jgi:predicted secreted protein
VARCVVYHRRFLVWWGLLLFVCKLGSRRQLDFHLRDLGTAVLGNVNLSPNM